MPVPNEALTDSIINNRILAMWCSRKCNTVNMAKVLGLPEHEVANRLAMLNDGRFA